MSNKIVKRFEKATFENYVCDTAEQKALVAYLREKIKNGFDENVFIIGGVGLGKTHLAYSILNSLCEKKEGKTYGYFSSDFVEYTSIKEIIDAIRRTWNNKCDTWDLKVVEDFKRRPLLIIDEIGIQYGSESERLELYEIFNARYNEMLPSIIISNCTLEQITNLMGQRITDRLAGGAKIFELKGKSKRGNSGND